jgi:hypothetical protein
MEESKKLFDELFSELMENQKAEIQIAGRYNDQLDKIARIRKLSSKDGIEFPLLDTIEEKIREILWGVSTALVGVVQTDALCFPAGYQVGKFIFQSSQTDSITFTLNEDCFFCVGGNKGRGTGEKSFALSPDEFVYDEESDKYFVYLVTDKTVDVSSSVPFVIEEV